MRLLGTFSTSHPGWPLLDLSCPFVPGHFGQLPNSFHRFTPPPLPASPSPPAPPPLPACRPPLPLPPLAATQAVEDLVRWFSAREGLLHCRAEAGCVALELEDRPRIKIDSRGFWFLY